MLPASIHRNNPFEGLTVRGVRESFESCPVKTTVAGAVFGASLLWGLKAAKKNGLVGALVKGAIAVAVMKRAKNVMVNGHARRVVAA